MKTYKLWKDNRLDQEFEVDADTLSTRFAEWLESKGVGYVNYYNTERLVRFFLTAKDGMSSVFEEAEFPSIMKSIGDCVASFEKSHA
jgi:hypothetical protein